MHVSLLLAGILLLAHFSIGARLTVDAQTKRWDRPDSLPAYTAPYNVDTNEFLMGMFFNFIKELPGDTVGNYWDYARWFNASEWMWTKGVYRTGGEIEGRLQTDTLAEHAQENERVATGGDPFGDIGGEGGSIGGQMIEAYLFDSAQSPHIVWKFLDVKTSHGVTQPNLFYDNSIGERRDWPWATETPIERVLSDPADAGLVAEHLAINYNVDSGHGWQDHLTNYAEGGGEPEGDFLQGVYLGRSWENDEERNLYVALKGHMIEPLDSNVAETDTIFRLKLVHAIPDEWYYLNDGEDTVQADGYTERVVDSFAVTRAALTADTHDLRKYRDVSFETDLRYRFNDPTRVGPAHPNHVRHTYDPNVDRGSNHLDLKVYWTGKERAAVRSVMLRNDKAELIYASGSESEDLRQASVDTARRLLHGLDASGDPDLSAPLRESILRLETGHESGQFGFGSFQAVKRLFKDSLIYNNGEDSVGAYMIEHNPPIADHAQHIGRLGVVHIEYNYYPFGQLRSDATGEMYDYLPAIMEHNGGATGDVEGPPILPLDPDAIDMYTHTLQRKYYGLHATTTSPYSALIDAGGPLRDLGYGA